MTPPHGSATMRTAWATYLCKPTAMVSWRPFGSPWLVLITPEAADLWQAFNVQLAHHAYTFDEIAGGTYNCRKVAGTETWSLHAYGIALDINPSRNKFNSPTYDYPTALIADLEAIRVGDRQAFQWGGRWGNRDNMHWQLGVTPTEIKNGTLTYPHQEDTDMPDIPCLYADGMANYKGVTGRPAMREVVRRFMYQLEALGFPVGDPKDPDRIDGRYGDGMAGSVLAFTAAENLKHPETGAAYDGKTVDATVEARLVRRYVEKVSPPGGTHTHPEYAAKKHGHPGLAKKDHPHTGTVAIES